MTTLQFITKYKNTMATMSAMELEIAFEHYQSLDYRSVNDDVQLEMLAIELDHREYEYNVEEEENACA